MNRRAATIEQGNALDRKRPVIAALLLAALLCGRVAAAADCTATGNGAWNLPATWSGCGGGVPGAGDTALINAGSTVTIPTGIDVTVAAIEFGATGSFFGLTVDGSLTVGDVEHFNNQINGSGPITVTGTYDWVGSNSGPLLGVLANGQSPLLRFAPGSTWNISGSLARLIQRNVLLEGTLNFTATAMSCSSNVTWLIASGATFNALQEGAIGSGGANCLIRNEGTIRKTGAGTTFRLSESRVRLENHGLIDVVGGTFDYDAGGGPLVHSGVFRIGAGATFGMPRSGATYSAGTLFEGGGIVRFTGANNTFQGDVDFSGPVQLASATGSSTVTAAAGTTLDFLAGMEWTDGILAGPGTFRFPAGQVLTISGAGVKTIASQAQVQLQGTTLWQGGTIQMPSSSVPPQPRLVNAAGATFEVQFRPATLSMSNGSNNSEFENFGEFTATANADDGALTISGSGRGSIINRGIMTLAGEVVSETQFWRQLAGQLILDDVRMRLTAESFNRPLTIEGGIVTGNAEFSGQVRSSGGVILPGGIDAIGAIGVVGSYSETADAVIEFEVAGSAIDAHDRFVVTGNPGSIDLRGTLDVLRLGNYQFGQTDAITIVDAVTAPVTSVPAAVNVDAAFAPTPEIRRDRSRIVLARDVLFTDDYEPPIPAFEPLDVIFSER